MMKKLIGVGVVVALAGVVGACSSDDTDDGTEIGGAGTGGSSAGSGGSSTTGGSGGATAGASPGGSGGSAAGAGGNATAGSGGSTAGAGGSTAGAGGAEGGAGGAEGGAGGDPNAPSEDCMTYCVGPDAVPAQCPDNFGGVVADCLGECAAQDNWDMACRLMHLGFIVAGQSAETHCPHTIGMGACADM